MVTGIAAGLASGFVALGFDFPAHPTPALLQTLSQLGVGLLIAYAVVISGREEFQNGPPDRENWLGFAVGIGCSGLLGSAVALAVAEDRAANGAGFLNDIGLWWAVGSIGMLGLIVGISPYLAYRWRRGVELETVGSADEGLERQRDLGASQWTESERPPTA